MVALDTLAEGREENRVLPLVLVEGGLERVELSCIMRGYNTSYGTTPRWTHQDFPDREVIINNDPDTGAEDGQDYAIWSITVPLSRDDVGVKTVICEYQQGNFVRSPEVKFQIYKISNIDITDLCESDGSDRVKVTISQEPGSEDRTPEEEVSAELRKQITRLFHPLSEVTQTANLFSISVPISSYLLTGERDHDIWTRGGDNLSPEDVREERWCPTTTTSTTTTIATTPSSTTFPTLSTISTSPTTTTTTPTTTTINTTTKSTTTTTTSTTTATSIPIFSTTTTARKTTSPPTPTAATTPSSRNSLRAVCQDVWQHPHLYMVPHPSDCSKFVSCQWLGGSKYLPQVMLCPPRTFYDREVMVCNIRTCQ